MRRLVMFLSFALVAVVTPTAGTAPAWAAAGEVGFEFETVGGAPYANDIYAFDAAGDGKLDLVTWNDTSLVVWTQGANGLAATPISIQLVTGDAYVYWADHGDVNGDGLEDIIYSNGGAIVGRLRQAGGGFGSAIALTGSVDHTYGRQVANMDSDAADELVYISYGIDGYGVTVMDRNGGTPTNTVLWNYLGEPSFVTGDLNDDGRTDLLTWPPGGAHVYVRRADGGWDETVPTELGAGTLADLNGDGHLDVHYFGTYYPGDGEGGFGPAVAIAGMGPSSSAKVGDLDGNGLDDVLDMTDRGTIRFQVSPGNFTSACQPFGETYLYLPELADLDLDGRADIISRGWEPLAVFWSGLQGEAVMTANIWPSSPFGQDVPVDGSLKGSLICPSGPLAGASVTLWRRDAGAGTFAKVDTATVSPDGYYAFADPRPNVGIYEYEVRFAGDATHAAATSEILTGEIFPSEGVDVVWKRWKVPYGDDAAFRIDLHAFDYTDNLFVDLYLKPAGQAETFWKTVQVNPTTGSYSGVLPSPLTTTILRAEWAGDAVWPQLSNQSTLGVSVMLRGRFLKASGTQGSWTLFKDRKNVYFATVVDPAFGKETFTVQEHVVGTVWRRFARGTFRPNANGVIVVVIPAGAIPVGKYRINAEHHGGAGLYPSTLEWEKFKVIR